MTLNMTSVRKLAIGGVVLAIALTIPAFFQSAYVLHILLLALMYAALALTYDIAAGHVGAVSLAHPVFFGLGAYLTAILAAQYGFPFWANMLVAMLLALILAFLIAIPAFRLRDLSFAIATLGLALTAQVVALNWVDVTEGPRCLRAVPRPSISLGQGNTIQLASMTAYYYLFLGLAVMVAVVYLLVTSWRQGRTFIAIRNDEVLAASIGIDVIHYKRLAFLVGASMAGAVGSLWAQYITVVCPDNLGIAVTNNLLIFVFAGGAGSFWGVIIAAVLFTIVPEVLRIAPSLRLILYGIILFIVVIAFPEGIGGALNMLARRLGKRGDAQSVVSLDAHTDFDWADEE